VATARIKTNPVRVKVYTDDYVIQGLVHTKPGGYKERVSDILNDPAARFMVLTDAWFRPSADEQASFRACETLIVRIEDVKLLVPFEEAEEAEEADRPGLSTWAG
jgi:hypothetical protein